MFVFIVYPKTDNHLYTYLQFVLNVQQNVSICAHRRLQKEKYESISLFVKVYSY